MKLKITLKKTLCVALLLNLVCKAQELEKQEDLAQAVEQVVVHEDEASSSANLQEPIATEDLIKNDEEVVITEEQPDQQDTGINMPESADQVQVDFPTEY